MQNKSVQKPVLYQNMTLFPWFIKQCSGFKSFQNIKVVPQKKKMSNDFLETSPECCLLIPVLRAIIKKICLLKR